MSEWFVFTKNIVKSFFFIRNIKSLFVSNNLILRIKTNYLIECLIWSKLWVSWIFIKKYKFLITDIISHTKLNLPGLGMVLFFRLKFNWLKVKLHGCYMDPPRAFFV